MVLCGVCCLHDVFCLPLSALCLLAVLPASSFSFLLSVFNILDISVSGSDIALGTFCSDLGDTVRCSEQCLALGRVLLLWSEALRSLFAAALLPESQRCQQGKQPKAA